MKMYLRFQSDYLHRIKKLTRCLLNEKTGEEKPFFIEYFLCNPQSGGDAPVFSQLEENKNSGVKPSYLMVKAGTWGEDAAQLHRFFGWNKIGVSFAGLLISYCARILNWLVTKK